MKSVRSRVATVWCKLMHPAPMWPVNGHYQCPACLRSYPVPWEHVRSNHNPDPAPVKRQAVSSKTEQVRAEAAAMVAAASR